MARPPFNPLTNAKPAPRAHLAIIERTEKRQGLNSRKPRPSTLKRAPAPFYRGALPLSRASFA